jgi:phosphoglycerate kinase
MDLSRISSLDDLNIEGRKVLVRVDFNVPLEGRVISDDTRIRAAMPTINYLLDAGARVILMSHLGRPRGKPNPDLSLEPVAMRLAEILDVGEVTLTDSCVGDGAKQVVRDMRDGHVVLLENLRFHFGETENDPHLVKELAAFGDVYVNDAFGSAHRAHASTVGVPSILRDKAAGLLMQKEIQALGTLLGVVTRPYIAVLGGAKVQDKIGLIENLLERVNTLIIGGAMANTFIAATGGTVGKSLVEKSKFPLARDLLARAQSRDIKVVLPTDSVVADNPDSTTTRVVPAREVPDDMIAFDIGPKSSTVFKEILGRAGTILWNGPMGMFEKEPFSTGTSTIAKAIAGASAFSVVGGGDSLSAVKHSGLGAGFDHISTGGGASLEFLQGKVLPGITALASEV